MAMRESELRPSTTGGLPGMMELRMKRTRLGISTERTAARFGLVPPARKTRLGTRPTFGDMHRTSSRPAAVVCPVDTQLATAFNMHRAGPNSPLSTGTDSPVQAEPVQLVVSARWQGRGV